MAKGETRLVYTVEQKTAAVLALYSNGRDFRSTARTLHLPVQTLRIWEKQYGKQVEDHIGQGGSDPEDSPIDEKTVEELPVLLEPNNPEQRIIPFQDDEVFQILGEKLTEDKAIEFETIIYQNIMRARNRAVRRAFDLLSNATSLRDIGYIISVLNDVPSLYPGDGDNEEGGVNHNSTIQKLTKRMIENANKVRQNTEKQLKDKQDEPV